MSEIKNSELLEKLIEYAKTYGGEDSTLTAERFLISVIDAVMGRTQIPVGEADRTGLFELMTGAFPQDIGFENLKKALTARIEEKKSSSFMDGLYIQGRILKAKDVAKENGMDLLGPDLLLKCIFEEPDAYLRPFITVGDNAGAGKAVNTRIDPRSILKGAGEKLERPAVETGKETQTEKPADEETPSNGENPKTMVVKLTEKVRGIRNEMLELVFGQDNAVNVFTAGYFQAELASMTDKDRKKPKATFLFAGPPGVGKTFLADVAAKALKIPFKRFDMSEYSDYEARGEFCGSDSVYRNGKEGNVTSFVARNPKSVVIFDEIEKAHFSVIHLFLQILDAGHIRDNNTDKEVSFADTIIIFTTNAGRQLYEDSDVSDFSGVTRKVILKALQNDINPMTGVPYFPAALCSRFASGNVVMFNYITAHDLCGIAKKEILKHSSGFENEVGIKVKIDESVYTALLFAEGGSADARTVTSRAESFLDDELFELFRLLDSDGSGEGIGNLETIHIGVDLPKDSKEIYELFERVESSEVLLIASKKDYELCRETCPETSFFNAQNTESAKKILRDQDVSFALIDITFGQSGYENYLNVEDVDSKARDIFWFVRETHPDIPIYLLQTGEGAFNAEEEMSFLRQGVRGVVTLAGNSEDFSSEIKRINEQLHQQKSMDSLAKANKLVSYETSQMIKRKGKTAEIRLFDFEMKAAIDAEDAKNVLSSVSKPDVCFEDVEGAEDAKKELRYFVNYLKNPKKYLGTGVSAPKGVLLYGPPGTGKTMLAKAMANESDVTFIAAEGNQFVNKYQGEGKDKIKELFRTARKYAPSIVFIDEIDAIAKERRGAENQGDIEVTLTALFTEMDGFKNDTSKPVFVLAATNFEVDPGKSKSLDPALMRRFDRRIFIDLPTKEERIRYIRKKISGKAAFELSDEKINNIAIRSTGMSLAALESIIELSLRTAIRDGNLKVTDEIFDEAFETFNGGEEKKWDSDLVKRVARHESGHAFLYWQSGETPSYVTVVARGDYGGYMQHDDNEGKVIYTKDELLAKIRTSLGGRAAEIVYYGDKDGISTGAYGDLVSATNTAKNIVCAYGMDEELGLAVVANGGENDTDVRKSVNRILDQEMKNAIRLIEENRSAIDALVERLMSENHLTGDEIVKVFEEHTSK